MWILYAIGSSPFAGITGILAKCGIRKTDSDIATAIRTVVVFLFSWLMVLITGTWTGIAGISGKTLIFLICPVWQRELPGCAIFMRCKKGTFIKLYRLISPARYLRFYWRLFSCMKGLHGERQFRLFHWCRNIADDYQKGSKSR